MRIILSPAKTMRDSVEPTIENAMYTEPLYPKKTKRLSKWLQGRTLGELKGMWKCSDKVAEVNYERIQSQSNETPAPAILRYDGIVFQNLKPQTLDRAALSYLQDHLIILSGYYGALRPLDGIVRHRLDVNDPASVDGHKNLYAFWGDLPYRATKSEDGIVIDLASKEYSKLIRPYLQPDERLIAISFVEKSKGQLVTKSTYSKMARGAMLRFMAQNQIQTPQGLHAFSDLGYQYREDLSTDSEFVFERKTTNDIATE